MFPKESSRARFVECLSKPTSITAFGREPLVGTAWWSCCHRATPRSDWDLPARFVKSSAFPKIGACGILRKVSLVFVCWPFLKSGCCWLREWKSGRTPSAILNSHSCPQNHRGKRLQRAVGTLRKLWAHRCGQLRIPSAGLTRYPIEKCRQLKKPDTIVLS